MANAACSQCGSEWFHFRGQVVFEETPSGPHIVGWSADDPMVCAECGTVYLRRRERIKLV